MTRAEFLSLPLPIQVRLLFDALDEESSRALLAQEKPKVPLPPKYDAAIYRQSGIMWASETLLEGLEYWRKKYQAGAEGGGQYAQQDAKRAANLEKWIAWRECFPETCWSGKRNDDDVVAKAPSSKPLVYPRANNGGQRRPPPAEMHDDVDPDNFTY
jgi:hypothetical protein